MAWLHRNWVEPLVFRCHFQIMKDSLSFLCHFSTNVSLVCRFLCSHYGHPCGGSVVLACHYSNNNNTVQHSLYQQTEETVIYIITLLCRTSVSIFLMKHLNNLWSLWLLFIPDSDSLFTWKQLLYFQEFKTEFEICINRLKSVNRYFYLFWYNFNQKKKKYIINVIFLFYIFIKTVNMSKPTLYFSKNQV